MREMISLNMKEQTRLMVLGEVDRGVMHVAEAAQVLALSERQVQRLLAAHPCAGTRRRGLPHWHTGIEDDNQYIRCPMRCVRRSLPWHVAPIPG